MKKARNNIIKEAKGWISSPQGREIIKQSVNRVKKDERSFKKSLQVKPKLLKEPFTI